VGLDTTTRKQFLISVIVRQPGADPATMVRGNFSNIW